MVNYKKSQDRLSAVFGALADPTRRAILKRLAGGVKPVRDISRSFKMTPAAVTKHLKVLERSGLISRGRVAQQRPCRLEAKPLKDAADWVEQYRLFWEGRFDRMEDYLSKLQAQMKEKKNGK